MEKSTLFELCLRVAGISRAQFARDIGVTPTAVHLVLNNLSTSARITTEVDRFINQHSPELRQIARRSRENTAEAA